MSNIDKSGDLLASISEEEFVDSDLDPNYEITEEDKRGESLDLREEQQSLARKRVGFLNYFSFIFPMIALNQLDSSAAMFNIPLQRLMALFLMRKFYY